MPRGRRYANDRAPTLEELRKLTKYPDRRIKPIVYTMVSSGIRLGAFDYLRGGDITPITKQDKIVAAKIVVYVGEEEEYFSFITKEAYDSLHEWMDYRKQCGEAVNKDTWLMRNLWDVTTPKGKGVVTIPKRLKSTGVKRLIERALWAQGLRERDARKETPRISIRPRNEKDLELLQDYLKATDFLTYTNFLTYKANFFPMVNIWCIRFLSFSG